MFHGKMKALTFSYDDGVTQDSRLIWLFDRYGMKATFNLNSGLMGQDGHLIRENRTVSHVKFPPEEITEIYRGHEIAVHTLTHPNLTGCDEAEIVRQVEEDRAALSALAGYEVRGMAYPGGGVNFDSRVADTVRSRTGVRYARTTVCTGSFDLPTDLIRLDPTVFHKDFDRLFALGEEFLALEPDTPKLFYIWGHSYEFDIDNTWDRFAEFLRMMAGKDDIFYGTNAEVLL